MIQFFYYIHKIRLSESVKIIQRFAIYIAPSKTVFFIVPVSSATAPAQIKNLAGFAFFALVERVFEVMRSLPEFSHIGRIEKLPERHIENTADFPVIDAVKIARENRPVGFDYKLSVANPITPALFGLTARCDSHKIIEKTYADILAVGEIIIP